MAQKIPEKVRINLEMPKYVKDRIERLKEYSEADSMAEVLRSALAVYEYLWQEKKKSSELIIREKDSKKETVVVLLPHPTDN